MITPSTTIIKVFVRLRPQTFDGSGPTADAIALFARAAVVIGVHGGALANLVACGEGVTTVLEIGFRSRFTRHYAAASAALGLQYVLIELELPLYGQGVAAAEVTLSETGVDAVARYTAAAAARAGTHSRSDKGRFEL